MANVSRSGITFCLGRGQAIDYENVAWLCIQETSSWVLATGYTLGYSITCRRYYSPIDDIRSDIRAVAFDRLRRDVALIRLLSSSVLPSEIHTHVRSGKSTRTRGTSVNSLGSTSSRISDYRAVFRRVPRSRGSREIASLHVLGRADRATPVTVIFQWVK